MSKRDHKASVWDWRSNPSHNTRRDYPARRAMKVTTLLKWIGLAVMVFVLVKAVGS